MIQRRRSAGGNGFAGRIILLTCRRSCCLTDDAPVLKGESMTRTHGVIVWLLLLAGISGLAKLATALWDHERTDAHVIIEMGPGAELTYNAHGDIDDLAPPG